MDKFGDVVFNWKGRECVVRHDGGGIMRMLRNMQDHVTIKRAFDDASAGDGDVNISRYAAAFSAALRSSGINVTADDVQKEMLTDAVVWSSVVLAVINIYNHVMPADPEPEGEEVKKKSPSAAKKKPQKKTK